MQEGSLQMGAREPRRGQIPPMKDPALGDDSLVDLGSRIEGEDHRIPPEPMEEVSQEMELE